MHKPKNEPNNEKVIGIIILLVSFLIIEAISLLSTPLNISDTNQEGYIIVVLLMLPITILISAKEDITINRDKNSYILGLSTFVIYIILLLYARSAMSFGFSMYYIQDLMFPLILIALILLIFGKSNLKRFKFLIIYSIFASPVILLPIITRNLLFTNINADIVFGILKAFGLPLSKSGLNIISPSGLSISIQTTCADIDAFVSLFMFILPVSYLYYGKFKNKVEWLSVSIILLFVLNIIRMLVISLIWAYSGLSVYINEVHLVLGQILFDIIILVMILFSGKFKLYIKPVNLKNLNLIKSFKGVDAYYGIFITVIVLSLVILFLEYPLLNSVKYNSTQINLSSNELNISSFSELSSLKGINMTISYGGNITTSNRKIDVFSLTNKSFNISDPIVVLIYKSNSPFDSKLMNLDNTSITSKSSILLNDGITLNYYSADSNNTKFYMNYFSLPSGNNSSVISFILLSKNKFNDCKLNIYPQDSASSALYNFINSNSQEGLYSCDSYKIIKIMTDK